MLFYQFLYCSTLYSVRCERNHTCVISKFRNMKIVQGSPSPNLFSREIIRIQRLGIKYIFSVDNRTLSRALTLQIYKTQIIVSESNIILCQSILRRKPRISDVALLLKVLVLNIVHVSYSFSHIGIYSPNKTYPPLKVLVHISSLGRYHVYLKRNVEKC